MLLARPFQIIKFKIEVEIIEHPNANENVSELDGRGHFYTITRWKSFHKWTDLWTKGATKRFNYWILKEKNKCVCVQLNKEPYLENGLEIYLYAWRWCTEWVEAAHQIYLIYVGHAPRQHAPSVVDFHPLVSHYWARKLLLVPLPVC